MTRNLQCLNPGDHTGEGRWCPDDVNMLSSYMEYLHPEPIDLISVHPYNGGPENAAGVLKRDTMRFGITGVYSADVLDYYKRAADRLGKPLMIGEFNDLYKGTWYPVEHRRNFARGVLKKIVDLQIPISAPWLWWDRLNTTNHFNIVPGATLTGEYVDLFESLFDSPTCS